MDIQEEWKKTGPKREELRKTRGIFGVPDLEREAYEVQVNLAIEKYALPKVPVMKVTPMMMILKQVDPELLEGKSRNQRRKILSRHNKFLAEEEKQNHIDKISNDMGSEAYWAMIHQEITIAEAMRFDKGIEAMAKE